MRASSLAFCNSRRRGLSSAKMFVARKASRAKGQPPRNQAGDLAVPRAPGGRAAARGGLRRRRSSPMRPGIAFVAAPCIRPRGARNATHTLFQRPARGERRPARVTRSLGMKIEPFEVSPRRTFYGEAGTENEAGLRERRPPTSSHRRFMVVYSPDSPYMSCTTPPRHADTSIPRSRRERHIPSPPSMPVSNGASRTR
jgi:hypothetical protein